MATDINPELEKALSVLAEYHPFADILGANNSVLDLHEWILEKPADMARYQHALITTAIHSTRRRLYVNAGMIPVRFHMGRDGNNRFVVWGKRRVPAAAKEGK